jgi:hypothetical protein
MAFHGSVHESPVITSPDLRHAHRPRRRAIAAAVVVIGLFGLRS